MFDRLWWGAISLIFIGFCILLWPCVTSAYLLEVAGRAVDAALEPALVSHLTTRDVTDPAKLLAGEGYLERALGWDPHSIQARRLLAHVYLSQGKAQAAIKTFQEALTIRPESPMLHVELGDVYHSLGESAAAIQAYETGSGLGSREHLMSFHYMRLANAEFDRGNRDEALRLSERALTADPSELHLLRDLMRLYRAIGDQKRADAYEEQLRYYSLGSLIVKDLPLAEYQGQAMAGLVKDGTWTHDMLLDVIAYQVWDFAAGIHGQMAERILRVLLEHWPDDADLLFYLAELYHRRGDLDQAEAAYRRVLAAEPQYAQVYLRMGQIFEARFATSEASSVQLSSFREIAQLSAPSSAYLQQAAFNYAQYFALAPEDFLGLKKLAEVCQSLKDARIEDESCRQAASHIKSSGNVSAANAASILDSVAILEEAMEVRTDNRRTVAALLGVEAEDINLGPNLVENGSVEVWQGEKPVGWVRSWMVGQELFNSALFVGGADEFGAFGGQTSARIDGLWIQQGDKLLPRAGFWQYDEANQTLRAVPLMTNTPYMLSFFYYTERVRDGNATVWISADPRVFWDGDLALPNTHRTWRQLVAVGFNRSEAVGTITPLIRSFARGRVQFDDIQLRAVRLREGSVVKVDGMRFRVTDASESIVDFE